MHGAPEGAPHVRMLQRCAEAGVLLHEGSAAGVGLGTLSLSLGDHALGTRAHATPFVRLLPHARHLHHGLTLEPAHATARTGPVRV